MSEKVEIYHGELILACHQIAMQFAKKHNLAYSNAEGHCLPYLERMAEAMADALRECNPGQEIVVLTPLQSAGEGPSEE